MGSTPGSVARRNVEIELKGKKYVAVEPDINELAMFESHIKSKRVEVFLEACQNVTFPDKHETIQKILQTSIENDELQAELTTLDGVRYMTYLILRGNPGVTLEGIGEIVDLSNIADVMAVIDSLGGEEEDPPLETAESP